MPEFQPIPEAKYKDVYFHSLISRFSPEAARPRESEDGSDVVRIMMRDGKKLVGMASLYESGDKISIGIIEVAADKRGKGYGSQLFEEVFRRAAESGRALEIGDYIDGGKTCFRPIEGQLAAKFPGLVIL